MLEWDERMRGWAAVGEAPVGEAPVGARDGPSEQSDTSMAVCSDGASSIVVGCGDALMFGVLTRYADEVEGVEPDERLVTRQSGGRTGGMIHRCPFDDGFHPGRLPLHEPATTSGVDIVLSTCDHTRDPF